VSAVCCIVLAAGFSERLGEEKALLETGQGPLVGWLASRLVRHGINPVVVTRREIASEVERSVHPCEVVVNQKPEEGRTGSIIVGISMLDRFFREGYRLLVVPIDRPGFSDSTLRKLIGSEATCCPSKDGRGGHPILLSKRDVEIIRRAPRDAPLRSLISKEIFGVEDQFLHLNIDSKENLEDFREFFESMEDSGI
jgi:molybdenum cofactor cytidylyltransferase